MECGLNYDENRAEEQLSMAIAGLCDALKVTVGALAKVKGTSDLSWFDDLKLQSVHSVQTTISETLPFTVDEKTALFAFDLVEKAFERLRDGLSDGQ